MDHHQTMNKHWTESLWKELNDISAYEASLEHALSPDKYRKQYILHGAAAAAVHKESKSKSRRKDDSTENYFDCDYSISSFQSEPHKADTSQDEKKDAAVEKETSEDNDVVVEKGGKSQVQTARTKDILQRMSKQKRLMNSTTGSTNRNQDASLSRGKERTQKNMKRSQISTISATIANAHASLTSLDTVQEELAAESAEETAVYRVIAVSSPLNKSSPPPPQKVKAAGQENRLDGLTYRMNALRPSPNVEAAAATTRKESHGDRMNVMRPSFPIACNAGNGWCNQTWHEREGASTTIKGDYCDPCSSIAHSSQASKSVSFQGGSNDYSSYVDSFCTSSIDNPAYSYMYEEGKTQPRHDWDRSDVSILSEQSYGSNAVDGWSIRTEHHHPFKHPFKYGDATNNTDERSLDLTTETFGHSQTKLELNSHKTTRPIPHGKREDGASLYADTSLDYKRRTACIEELKKELEETKTTLDDSDALLLPFNANSPLASVNMAFTASSSVSSVVCDGYT